KGCVLPLSTVSCVSSTGFVISGSGAVVPDETALPFCAAAPQQAATNRVTRAMASEDLGEGTEQIRITGTPLTRIMSMPFETERMKGKGNENTEKLQPIPLAARGSGLRVGTNH